MSKHKRNYIIRKDKSKRISYFNSELTTKLFKHLQLMKYNILVSSNVKLFKDKYNYYQLLLNKRKYYNYCNMRSKCLLTGRSRSIYKDFRLSRMQLRSLASFGLLAGVKKASW